jgi:hypothetical protein
MFISILEGITVKRNVVLEKKSAAVKLFSAGGFVQIQLEVQNYAAQFDVKVVVFDGSCLKKESLHFDRKFFIKTTQMQREPNFRLAFGVKIKPVSQNQCCFLVVSWLTNNNKIMHLISTPFIPMTRNNHDDVRVFDSNISYISKQTIEIDCKPQTNEPNVSFMDQLLNNNKFLSFRNYFVYHLDETKSVEHPMVALTAVDDITNNRYNTENKSPSYQYVSEVQQIIDVKKMKMISSSVNFPNGEDLVFAMRGEGSTRSNQQM